MMVMVDEVVVAGHINPAQAQLAVSTIGRVRMAGGKRKGAIGQYCVMGIIGRGTYLERQRGIWVRSRQLCDLKRVLGT